MLKKSWLLLIFVVLILSGCSKKEDKNDLYQSIMKKGNLTVAISFDSKPFGFKDSNGQIKGIEADLAREIARRMFGSDKKVIFVNVSPRERIQSITSGKADMVMSTMTITPEREKIVNFSDPYFIAGQAICVKKTSDIDSYQDLNNKNVVVILGTTGEANIRNLEPNAIIQGYINNADAFNAFENPGVDAIITDDSLLFGLIIKNDNYKLLPERLSKEPYGIAFKKSNTSSFKKQINKILNDLKKDGTLETIKENWGVY